jgi:hypothetical protein
MRLRKGAEVIVTGWPKLRGTVTQVRKRAACVLFPIRRFAWFPIDRLRVARSTKRRRPDFVAN